MHLGFWVVHMACALVSGIRTDLEKAGALMKMAS
jgi:hypothetical protein